MKSWEGDASGSITLTGRHDSAAAHRRAHRLLLLVMIAFLTGSGIGLNWDRAWHATHPFEDFWSPPHIFIYVAYGLTATLFSRLALIDEVRVWFGPTIRVPMLAQEVPGSIALAGFGLATIAVAGLLDDIWHSSFGLDETGWSLPHVMLGWGMLLTFLGLVSCRLALQSHHPFSRLALILLGTLALTFVAGVFVGPMGNNNTPELVRRVAALPVLAAEESVQHTFRIYLTWNITRTSPLFVPLSAFAAGAGLALTYALLRRRAIFLLVVLLVTLLTLSGELRTARFFGLAADARTWLPLPFLPAALALTAGSANGRAPRRVWWIAGALFGIFTLTFCRASLLLLPLAVLAMGIGAGVGERIYNLLEMPTEHAVKRFVMIAALGVPSFLGIIDLFLRASTP